MTGDHTQADRMARPLLSFSCDMASPAKGSQDLLTPACQALREALQDRFPGHVLRQVRGASPDFSNLPARKGNLAVRLVLDAARPAGLSGHLEWRTGAGSDVVRGPQMRLRVMDATLSPAMLGRFVGDLLRHSPEFPAHR